MAHIVMSPTPKRRQLIFQYPEAPSSYHAKLNITSYTRFVGAHHSDHAFLNSSIQSAEWGHLWFLHCPSQLVCFLKIGSISLILHCAVYGAGHWADDWHLDQLCTAPLFSPILLYPGWNLIAQPSVAQFPVFSVTIRWFASSNCPVHYSGGQVWA